jgi:hypothetical protein
MNNLRGKGGTYYATGVATVATSGDLGDTKGGGAVEFVGNGLFAPSRTIGSGGWFAGDSVSSYRGSLIGMISHGDDDSFWIYLKPTAANMPQSYFQRIIFNTESTTLYSSAAVSFSTNSASGDWCFWQFAGFAGNFTNGEQVWFTLIS